MPKSVLLLACCAGGCAVNDSGAVRVHRYQSDTAWVVALECTGVHVVTHRANPGLTIGRSEQVYFFKKPPAADPQRKPTEAAVLAAGAGSLEPVGAGGGCPPMQELGTPFFSYDRSTGVIIRTGAERFGVSVGATTRSAVVVPRDFQGILFVDHDARHPARSRAILQEERP